MKTKHVSSAARPLERCKYVVEGAVTTASATLKGRGYNRACATFPLHDDHILSHITHYTFTYTFCDQAGNYFVNGLLQIRICFSLCCGFVVSLVWTMGRPKHWKTKEEAKMEQLPPPPPPPPIPPPGELRELPEDKQKKNPGAPREKTAAEIWLGSDTESNDQGEAPLESKSGDVDLPIPDCVQGKAPLEGKYSDQGSEGSEKAPGVRYQ